METIARWWASDSTERYWLEVSDRGSDLGADLNAPASNETGGAFWSYDLLREVEDGDIVLHYDRPEHAIVAWSQAVGVAWPDQVVWAARGMLARSRGIRPHERDGWRVSLNGPFRLAGAADAECDPRAAECARGYSRNATLLSVRARPAETRPMQGYLFKLPAAFVELFPELHEVPRSDAVAPFEVALPHAPPGPAGAWSDQCSCRETRMCARGRPHRGRGIHRRSIALCRLTRGWSGSSLRRPPLKDGALAATDEEIPSSICCSRRQGRT